MEVKIKVLKVFLFITIVIILIMGVSLFLTTSNKSSIKEETEVLKAEIEKLKTEKSKLEAKITAISNIVNDTTIESEKNIKIEGTYQLKENEKSEDVIIYTFKDGNVEYKSKEIYKGTFEIKGDKIRIIYKEVYNVDGERVKSMPKIETEELTIINENTLELNGVKIIKK